MSAFSGPQGRGAGRAQRELKRLAAEKRNARTPDKDRRVFREGLPARRRRTVTP